MLQNKVVMAGGLTYLRLMKQQTPFYLKKIRDEFELRKNRRSNYSLRSFAMFLEIEAASLSSVLKGVRRLSKTKVAKVASKLNLSPEESSQFISSNLPPKKNIMEENKLSDTEQFKLNSETHFRIISEWEHYAILSLVETIDFQPKSKWIAERLGISDLRARICVENLLQAGLIKAEDINIILTHRGLKTTEDVPSHALRKARKQDLELALNSIDEISVELRDFSSSTMTLNLQDLQELKKMIRDFRKCFMSRAEKKKGNEVYKLSVQLLPLTKRRSSRETN